jgi:hypothetical protein
MNVNEHENDKYTQMQRLSTGVKGTAQLVPQAVSHIFGIS